MATEPQGPAVGRLGWLESGGLGRVSVGGGWFGPVSEAIRDRGNCRLRQKPGSPAPPPPLLQGLRSPWGHAGSIAGCGAPRWHHSCGLVPGASGTRTGTRCSPLQYCCSSVGPVAEEGAEPTDKLSPAPSWGAPQLASRLQEPRREDSARRVVRTVLPTGYWALL